MAQVRETAPGGLHLHPARPVAICRLPKLRNSRTRAAYTRILLSDLENDSGLSVTVTVYSFLDAGRPGGMCAATCPLLIQGFVIAVLLCTANAGEKTSRRYPLRKAAACAGQSRTMPTLNAARAQAMPQTPRTTDVRISRVRTAASVPTCSSQSASRILHRAAVSPTKRPAVIQRTQRVQSVTQARPPSTCFRLLVFDSRTQIATNL